MYTKLNKPPMFRSSKITMAIIMAAQFCSYSYGQTRAALWADTPVRVRAMQSPSPALQIGQQVDFQVADAVWAGNAIVIPRGANVIGEIAEIHRLSVHPEIEIRFIYMRAASGERVPLHSGRDPRALWKVRLIDGTIPGLKTTVYVSGDRDINTLVAAESNQPGGTEHAGDAKPDRPLNGLNRQ